MLREEKYGISINKDLTLGRKKNIIFYECRQLFKAECFNAAYTLDGIKHINDNENKKFGYEVSQTWSLIKS